MQPYLTALAEGHTFTITEAEAIMHLLMQGEATELQMAALLLGLRSRGETLDELTGFTRVMREYAVPVTCNDPNAIDVCGTGGDRSGTFNVSTAVTLVCAGAGVTVAKHGNRSVSSLSGSADVLAALGVKTDLGKNGVETCLNETGVAFLFAPLFHPALKHVMPVRRALGVRTFFNILGPLCNPAKVERQLVGAFNAEMAKMMAEILTRLGSKQVMTVHAHDGLDEISTSAATDAFRLTREGTLLPMTVTPEAHQMPRVDPTEVRGGDAVANATILTQILNGERSAKRDIVVLNAAYALSLSGKFPSLEDAFAAANESLDRGSARQKLTDLIRVSNQLS